MQTQLGQRVTDLLTQHTGIVTGRATYLDPTKEPQALVSEHWIDESRLQSASA